MPIPKFDEIMHPILKFLSDNKQHSTKEINEQMANHFKLTSEEKTQLAPNGTKRIFDNRCDWARFYLKKAQLITSPKRSILEITEEGMEFLKSHKNSFDKKTLMTLPTFFNFVEESEYQRNIRLQNID